MKKIHNGFIVFYLIWTIANLLFFILAMTSVFGVSNTSNTEFWPFTVGAPRYYDYYELAVYLLYPLLVYVVYRQGKSKRFWIPYVIWGNICVIFMLMAVSDVFGASNRNLKEFWPFSVGGLKYYDLLEMVVYMTIPLVVYFLLRLIKKGQHHHSEQ